jgi:hypothetical protein
MTKRKKISGFENNRAATLLGLQPYGNMAPQAEQKNGT